MGDVLKKSKETKAKDGSLKDMDTDSNQDCPVKPQLELESLKERAAKQESEISEENEEKKKFDSPWIDIGTWSNEMAANPSPESDFDFFDPNAALPGNVTMIPNMAEMGSSGWGISAPGSGWGSPTPLGQV